jgi:tetratricopeptide (TPR) repeat protein
MSAVTPHECLALEQCLLALDRALRRGERPDLTALLPAGVSRPAALIELIHAELEYRLKNGERAGVEDYLARYPELAGRRDAVRSLAAAEFRFRRRQDPGLQVADFCCRFPQLSPDDLAGSGTEVPPAVGLLAPAAPPADRYEFLGELGRGGMGAVLRVHDRHLGRGLALKTLLECHRDNSALWQRFLAEARVAGQLQHPGVAPVYELGELPDGRPFFSMKLVEGRTLAELLKERASPAQDLPRFVKVFEQVAQAVAYAHSRRVLHRDLKPANIMVGNFGEVQVMDWGLAKVLPEGPVSDSLVALARAPEKRLNPVCTPRGDKPEQYTQAGAVVGTPAYMAPEQARGVTDRLDEGCDVFGLGAILCEILTGKPPYVGDDMHDVLAQALRSNLGGAVERLDGCGADAELIRLAKDCLAADPAARPRHGGTVAAAVTAYLAGVQERLRAAELTAAAEQAQAAEVRAKARAERRAQRLTVGLAASVVLTAALLAGGWMWVEGDRAARQAERARQESETRSAVQARLDEATDHQRRAEWPEAQAALERAAGHLGAGGPEELQQRLAQVRTDLLMVARLDEIRMRRESISNDTLDLDIPSALAAYAAAFRDYGLGVEGDERAVVERLQQSTIKEQLLAALDDWAEHTPDKALCAHLMAVARRVDPDPWRDRFRDPAARADAATIKRLDSEAPVTKLSPIILEGLADRLRRVDGDAVGRLRQALRQYPSDFLLNIALGRNLYYRAERLPREQGKLLREEAIGLLRAGLATRPRASMAWTDLGIMLFNQRRYPEAEAADLEAIHLQRDNARLYTQLSAALRAQGKFDEAEAAARTAIHLKPNHAPAYGVLANALWFHGKPLDAEVVCHQGMLLDRDYYWFYVHLSGALLELARPAEAEREADTALHLRPDIADAHRNLGLARFRQENYEGAETAYDKALKLDPDFAICHMEQGHVLKARGRFDEAVASYRRGHDLAQNDPGWKFIPADKVHKMDPILVLEEKWLAVSSGKSRPADGAQLMILAHFAAHAKNDFLGAARMFQKAFEERPEIAISSNDIPWNRPLYLAGCCAAKASQVKQGDAAKLTDAERAMWRRQALGWLRQELGYWDRQIAGKLPSDRVRAARELVSLEREGWLAGVRDEKELADLPSGEQAAWRELWVEVTELLRRTHAAP